MKNKKLFAILTLVCFMMTLMPVAAFADANAETVFDAQTGLVVNGLEDGKKYSLAEVNDEDEVVQIFATFVAKEGKVTFPVAVVANAFSTATTEGAMSWRMMDSSNNIVVIDENEDPVTTPIGEPDFGEFTVADSMSAVWTKDTKVDARKEAASFNLKVTDVNNPLAAAVTDVYVWVTAQGSNVPLNTFSVNGQPAGSYVCLVENVASGEGVFDVTFMSPGSFQVHVSSVPPTIMNGSVVAGTSEFKAAGSVVTATVDSDNTKDYVITTDITGGTIYDEYDDPAPAGVNYLADGYTYSALQIAANNVDEKAVTIRLQKPAAVHPVTGEVLAWADVAGAKVDIEVVGAITTDKTSVYTNALGQATFKVGGNRDGVYKVYLSTGKYESTIEVKVGAIVANSIEAKAKTGKYDILGEGDFAKVISFKMYDVNGNKLTADVKDDYTHDQQVAAAAVQGWGKAADSTNDEYAINTPNGTPVDATGYVAIVEKPADSKMTNDDLYFTGKTIALAGRTIDAEGTYTFKVVLDNGAYATATCEVKAFDRPVQLIIDGADNIELGATIGYATVWVDANGVKELDTKGVETVATGYAVEAFNDNGTGGSLTAKSDEKYEGSKITLTAVDDRYNLVATKEVTIAAAAQGLKFATNTAKVNVNNYIDIYVVDANGKNVALELDAEDENDKVEISYVVLEKPEGANVFLTTYKEYDLEDRYFTMNLTSNKVGNVKVQAIAKYVTDETTPADKNEVANVVKYYTGTATIAVGTAEIGKSVVMSIGSNELIVGSKVTTMDAKPMIQNSRTYVPFRALAEAFGATVAYDQATSSVTAELNGVKVVMTVGSPVYTVNGVEKTADVAPFISDSRTFVPVRFAAEAFGIEVVPTYNTDGSVADVLFNM